MRGRAVVGRTGNVPAGPESPRTGDALEPWVRAEGLISGHLTSALPAIGITKVSGDRASASAIRVRMSVRVEAQPRGPVTCDGRLPRRPYLSPHVTHIARQGEKDE